MPALEDVWTCPAIHAARQDGALLTAVRVPLADPRLGDWGWILYVSRKNKASSLEDARTLTENIGDVEYRRVYSSAELKIQAQKWGCTDWQEGYQPGEEKATEPTAADEESTPIPPPAPANSPYGLGARIANEAAIVASKTRSQTQKIVAEQIQLGSTYYQNVAVQLKQSFDLAWVLTAIGALVFLISVLIVLLPLAHGNAVPVGIVGTFASTIIEAVAGFSFLYNKASAQFARFHLFLDRISRASLAHTMCDAISDEAKRQEILITIIQDLLKEETFSKP